MSFAIFRVAKLKTWSQVKSAGGHNHRTRETQNADPIKKNIFLMKSTDIQSAAMEKIGEQTIRKNAVLAVEVLISASPEFFRPNQPEKAGYWEDDRLDAWRKKMEPWIKETFPHAISVVLHLDEATPHYQIIEVPLDKKGKLNAREKYGGPQVMREWQDRVALAMKDLGIRRGVKGSKANHEKISQYYRHVNSSPPKRIYFEPKTPIPDGQLKIFGQLKAYKEREQERVDFNEKAKPVFERLHSRSIELQTQQKKTKEYQQTALKKEREVEELKNQNKKLQKELDQMKQNLKELANNVRSMPLDKVLIDLYGATESADSKPSYSTRKFKLPSGVEIAVTLKNGVELWIEQGTQKGGGGAIDLVMHLEKVEFKEAVTRLSGNFTATEIRNDAKKLVFDQTEKALMEPILPEPVAENWPWVKNWLIKKRGIPEKLVDWVHKKGLVYADKFKNAVFKREKGGAFLRGTLDKVFKRTIGVAELGSFVLPGTSKKVILVEGPVDALAVKAIDSTATVMAVGGNLVNPKVLANSIKEGSIVETAFDNDDGGKNLSDKINETFMAPPWEGKDISKTGHKDWPEAILKDSWRIDDYWKDGREVEDVRSSPNASKEDFEAPEPATPSKKFRGF